MQRWCRHFVHLITIGFACRWSWGVFESYRAGYFSDRRDSTWVVVSPLLPGLTLVVLSIICSWLVYRCFRVRPQQSESTQ